ncbi:MAG: DUF2188 domain-containing protein [Methanomassiliicoccaceae archaeon]|nr:DUF2188 domain-containing protein [Methanomassiliicoccaceae archaeon]
MADGKKQHIMKHPDGGWQVKGEGNTKATRIFDTKAEALEYAKTVAKNQGSTIVPHKKDGKIQKKK